MKPLPPMRYVLLTDPGLPVAHILDALAAYPKTADAKVVFQGEPEELVEVDQLQVGDGRKTIHFTNCVRYRD